MTHRFQIAVLALLSAGSIALTGCESGDMPAPEIPGGAPSLSDSISAAIHVRATYAAKAGETVRLYKPAMGVARMLVAGRETEPQAEYTFPQDGDITVSYSLGDMSATANLFQGCTALKEVTFSEGMTAVGSFACSGCSALEAVHFPSTLTHIGGSAFEGCSSLSALTLPKGLASIGYDAFKGCYALRRIVNYSPLDIEKGSSLHGGVAYYASEVISSNAMEGDFLFQADAQQGYALVSYTGTESHIVLPEGYMGKGYTVAAGAFRDSRSLESVVIPEGVTSLGEEAFCGCSALKAVSLPMSMTSVGERAFQGCAALPAVQLPEGMTSLEAGTFHGCTSLKEITLPSTLVELGGGAFYGCAALQSVYSRAKIAPAFGENPFRGMPTEGVVYVPQGHSGYTQTWIPMLGGWSIQSTEDAPQMLELICSDGKAYTVEECITLEKQPFAVVFYRDDTDRIQGAGYAVLLEDIGQEAFADSTGVKQNTSSDITAYDGQSNTFQLFANKAVSSSMASAAYSCLPAGKQLFVPSVAEMRLLYEVREEVNEVILQFGGDPLADKWYWTSTEVQGQETASAWLYSMESGLYIPADKTQPHWVRPVLMLRY